MKLDWSHIDTIFLDMDGTLLDLHFDNYFWLEHVPLRYAQMNDMDVDQAKQELFPRFRKIEGTLEWYCIDHWSNELGLDIAVLKEEVNHLISVHPHVTDFLGAVRLHRKRVVLVTNAHGKSLTLKMEKTQLGGHFDALICSHDMGLPKEDPAFWSLLQQKEPFDKDRTILVDDSLSVLRSADSYGIRYLCAIYKPDTQSPVRDIVEFPAIHSFLEITPELQS
ncbi:MAG TPA: GMP/IMP nucleotidase [Gammaproteobacteria bacterium]|nr:GMP/IMP nucleotidase [Gammaproteobacteria bacterium]